MELDVTSSFPKTYSILVLLPLLTPGLLRSQQGVPASADRAASAMQDSIARQMASIATSASAAMAGSLKMQRDAIQKQMRTAATIAAPSDPSSEKSAVTGPRDETAPPSGGDQQGTSMTDNTSGEYSSFFASPWSAPEGFQMPNVQVESGECDALPDTEVSQLVSAASSKHTVGANLIRAVMRQESGFRPCAQSTAGAMGLMQIMPDTASDLGLSDPFDPAANVDAGTRYLKQMLTRYNGDETLALSAYNAGPGRVDKAGGIPPISETMNYVSRILSSLPGL
jgi:Transglycosylase SLT domain